ADQGERHSRCDRGQSQLHWHVLGYNMTSTVPMYYQLLFGYYQFLRKSVNLIGRVRALTEFYWYCFYGPAVILLRPPGIHTEILIPATRVNLCIAIPHPAALQSTITMEGLGWDR